MKKVGLDGCAVYLSPIGRSFWLKKYSRLHAGNNFYMDTFFIRDSFIIKAPEVMEMFVDIGIKHGYELINTIIKEATSLKDFRDNVLNFFDRESDVVKEIDGFLTVRINRLLRYYFRSTTSITSFLEDIDELCTISAENSNIGKIIAECLAIMLDSIKHPHSIDNETLTSTLEEFAPTVAEVIPNGCVWVPFITPYTHIVLAEKPSVDSALEYVFTNGVSNDKVWEEDIAQLLKEDTSFAKNKWVRITIDRPNLEVKEYECFIDKQERFTLIPAAQ